MGDWQQGDDTVVVTFSMPGPGNKSARLSVLNVLQRDARIQFFEKEHQYQVDGCVRVPRSVIGLMHQFEHPFDADETIRKMRAGKNRPANKEKYTNADGGVMTDEEIKALWVHNRRGIEHAWDANALAYRDVLERCRTSWAILHILQRSWNGARDDRTVHIQH